MEANALAGRIFGGPIMAAMFSSPTGRVWFFLAWVIGVLLAAVVFRLAWTRGLGPLLSGKRTTYAFTLTRETAGQAQFVFLVAGIRIGLRVSFPAPAEVMGPLMWSIVEGGVYTAFVAGLTALLYSAARSLVEWYAANVAGRTESDLDDRLVVLFRKVAKLVFIIAGAVIVLDRFGVKMNALLATAGVASLAVAFAAQETLANMIAGFALMLDRPFKEGDRVELADGKLGDVIEVGLRSTKILSFDHTVIVLPNSEIAKSQITNLSAPSPRYVIRNPIGVAYGSDLRKVKRILFEIMTAHPEVLKDPPPAVYFTSFGDSSLDLLYVCAVGDYRQQFRIRDEINMVINDRFAAEGVEIPFPQRVVHLRGPAQEERTK